MAAPSTRAFLSQGSRLDVVAKRAARDAERHERALRRGDAPQATSSEVAASRARIARLTRCHAIGFKPTNWYEIAARGPRPMPTRMAKEEAEARRALTSYRPSLADRLLGLESDKRRVLVERVVQAAAAGEAAFQKAKREVELHNAQFELAKRLLEIHLPTIEKVIPTHTRLVDVADLIEGLKFSSPSPGWLQAVVGCLEVEDMPDEVFDSSGGETAPRPMPRAQRNDLHRHYVCALALRLAGELIPALPIDGLEVIVQCVPPDQPDGFDRRRILQLKIGREALARLDLPRAEPLATLAELGARMNWSAQHGFGPLDDEPRSLNVPTIAEVLAASKR